MTLKQGSSGSDVKKLQTALMSAGYDVGTAGADGIFGKKTEAAVKAYQKANGLVVDGLAGNKTLGSLYGSSKTNTSSSASQNTNKENTPKVKGVDNTTLDKGYNSSFTASKDWNAANKDVDSAANKYSDLANKTNIISSSTKDRINSDFEVSDAYIEAMNYTNSLLQKLNSGRTSYTDQVEAMMAQIQNREDFEYDVDKDQLFQQALASAMGSGKTAMQDTIGQASALTGGYGSTYATSAGNQAYNAFIEDAYNNLPEYYQMALNAYQMEGEEMYKELAMLSDADAREYQRTFDAFNANFANAQNIYNQDFNLWQANTNNAFQSANLQLDEHNTLLNAAYNSYNLHKDKADTMYNREYQNWADEVAQAQQLASLLNSDAWNQTNFDESVRQYDQNYALQQEQFAEEKRQFDATMAENKRQFDTTMAYNKSKGGGGSGGSGGSGKTSNLTDSQIKTAQELYIKAGGGDAGLAEVDGYLSAIGKNNLSEEGASYLMSTLNDATIPSWYQNWTITKDSKNWFGGNDNNDKYSNGSTTKSFKELKKEIENSGLKKDEQEKILNKLKSQSKK